MQHQNSSTLRCCNYIGHQATLPLFHAATHVTGWKGCHVTSLRGKGADRDRHISLANIIRIVQRCPQLLLSFAAASATGPADRVGRCFLVKALQRYSSSSQKVRKHMEWILTLCTAADAVTAWQQRGSNANWLQPVICAASAMLGSHDCLIILMGYESEMLAGLVLDSSSCVQQQRQYASAAVAPQQIRAADLSKG